MQHPFLSSVAECVGARVRARERARTRGWAKKFLAAALAFVGFAAMAAQPATSDSLTMADFGHKIKLQINGYTGSGTLANFPVLVRVSEAGIPGFHYNEMSATNSYGKTYGYDLAFFSEDGTRLPCEIDTWSHSAGKNSSTQLVWVALSQMTPSTKFYMCYSVQDGVYVTNANPWAEYVGVWHLNATNNASAYGTYPNSTLETGIDGEKACRSLANESGVIGKSVCIAKNQANWMNSDQNQILYGGVFVPDSGDNSPLDLGSSFTISGWFKYNGAKMYRYDKVLFKRTRTQNDTGETGAFAIQMNSKNSKSGKISIRGSGNDKGGDKELQPIMFNANWVYLTFSYNGDNNMCTVYTNGSEGVKGKFDTIVNNNQPLCFGNNVAGIGDGVGENAWNGWIDEVRLSAGPANADWVKAEYDTVNNAAFVTVAPKDPPAVAWVNAEGATPGTTSIGVDTVAVSGTIQSCGDFDTAAVQCKVWPTAGSEPGSWTTLTNGLVASDAFSATISGLAASTAYSYKLRAVGADGNTASVAVSGSFTTLAGFSVAWTDAVSGAEGLSAVAYNYAVVGGTVVALGGATACEIQFKVWADGGSEPAGWTTITNGLVASDVFSVVIPGLSPSTTYNYSLRAVGNDEPPSETTPVTSTFTTAAGLTIAWSSATSATGLSQVSYDFVRVGGTVSALGGATKCSVQYKVWASGGAEPGGWTILADNLALNAGFSETISGLAVGTAYNYKLKAVGDDEEESETVSGSFTTSGNSGEEIGSSETHFYDDGTNAYWVANEFERYLPFEVTGYTGSETLTNFPVLVDVRKNDTNGFSYDDFYHVGGRDIVFVDEKGHVIPHEIDTWNPNGMTLIWVRLPEMNNGTKFTMCYRSPLVNPPADPGNAFERYVGVWHMNEKADGIVDVVDSTTNHLDGETHANSLAYSNGYVGGARRVAQHSGTSSTYGHIIVDDKNDILRTGVGNVFTYSCWSKLADSKPGWAYLVSRKSEDASNGWGVQYHDNNSSTQLRAYGGSTVKNEYQLFNVSGYSHIKWAYWTFVFSNQTFSAYLNGNFQSTITLKHPVANDDTATYDNLVIGGQEVGTGALNGWVDECRYSKGVRSPDWIKAEYDSMLQVNTPFVTKGTQVGRGVESLVPVVVWETGAGLPETVVDVSYAYVQFAGTVTFCGSGADTCRIEYQMWADGEEEPGRDDWTTLLDNATAGTKFSIPVFGLKQDMPYNFRIRAVNVVGGETRKTFERVGSFRTNGNVNESAEDGELMRIGNRFVHLYRAGTYTFTTPDYVTNVEIMVVGGGGAGGYKIGGGGGGGGVFYSQSYGVTADTTYHIMVGRGGNAPTNATTASSEGNGEYSAFSLDADHEHPLISVPGGGGGGSCSTTANVVNGHEGASGGGAGAFGNTSTTVAPGGAAASVDGVTYGHKGGDSNKKQNSASDGAYAAGGGGGGRTAGLAASSDKYYGGGSGGSGVACALLGEMLYFGAGGGGGYAYWEDASGFSKPGAGGSGVGGNAADVKNGTLATSGVENTGAGGGGGSMTGKNSSNSEYWQGGDGGDGVVMIAYEVHGRDPISEEPRISMTRCAYNESDMTADIDYRVYWAGMQNDVSDILVHYSTVSSNELDNTDSGVLLKVAESAVGTGSTVFVPPEVGYTYWVRLVARKHASSYSSSEEIASFTVPAVTLNGATWTESKTSPSEDFATVSYKLFDTNAVTHLYCYWSESEAALEGDEPPSGDDVYLLDLGANTGKALSDATSFNLAATEGLVRNRTYYIRLACGDAQGIKRFLSDEILSLDTAEKPATVLTSASWSSDGNAATVNFKATAGKLDPAEVELVALYSLVESDVKGDNPVANGSVTVVGLGFCSDLALDVASPSATFPLWSEVVTNYYVRLALSTNVIVVTDGVATTNRVIVNGSYSASSATKTISVSHAIEANTLIYIVTANPKVMCYGDEPLPLDYMLEYAGQTEGWGWTNKYDLTGAIACYESTNPTPVAVCSTSPSGNYPITQGTLLLENGGQTKNPIIDGVEVNYQYKLSFSGATYTITNAVFATTIADAVTNYTGDAYDTNGLARALSGVRNEQPVTYLYRVGGAGEWGEMPDLVDVGNYNVQFKASAPNHDDVRGSFALTIVPARLEATIGAANWAYTGAARQPVVTTNVTGLVHPELNALTCEFRDEAGEWRAEPPSFVEPGEYKLFFRVSAPNHATFTTNCTFTIEGWDYMVNMDGETGYQTAINVTDPGWFLRATGLDGDSLSASEARYAKLDETCANGLKLWQNYVIEHDDLTKKLVAAIHQNCQRVAGNNFELRFPNIDALRNTGLDVFFRVDRKLKGETEFTQGELTDKYEVNVPLGPHDPTGLYLFSMVLATTNAQDSGQAVLSSVATVGVLRVSSALTNTVLAVPWRSMSVDTPTNVNVAVADVVNPNGTSQDDMVLVYDSGTGDFNGWMHDGYGDWEKVATVTKKGVTESAAEVVRLPRGSAFWLVRSEPSEYIYLLGRYTGDEYDIELAGGSGKDPGHTLVANPTMFDVALNDLEFVDEKGNKATPSADDRIVVQTASGLQLSYTRRDGEWGRVVATKVGRRITQTWTPGGTIPSGTGFWYVRNGEGVLRIKFGAK